jgi:hypothetical protein
MMKFVICCVVSLCTVPISDLNTAAYTRSVEIRSFQTTAAKLLHRFESPVSPAPAWDLLRGPLRNLSKESDRKAFAIRICSEKRLLLSIPTAVADPFQIIRTIRSRYEKPLDVPPIFLLRTDDCNSSYVPVEVWAIGKDAQMPTNIERYESGQIIQQQLGFDPSICSTKKIDHKIATKKLIRKMHSDPNSFGAVIGYYDPANGAASPDLQLRVEEAKRLLKKSGISQMRYSVSYEIWHADDSACSVDPVTKPSVYFLTSKRKR